MAATLTIAIIVLIPFLACLAYLWWIAHSAFKRRWRKLAILVAAPIAVAAIFAAGILIWSKVDHTRYLDGLFDAHVTLPKPIYSYDSERAFNGDGFSISVYDLPDSIRKRFAAADKSLLSEFPRRPSYRSHWNTLTWRQAPFDHSLDMCLGFALSCYESDRIKGLPAQFSAIRTALAKPNTFYAMFYNGSTKSVGDMDFFVVDLDNGKLYLINQNT